jgi:hypothetical protein
MNHGSTEDTETATENCKDLVGVPFTLKLFSVSSVIQGGRGDYRLPPNLPSRKNPMSCRDRPSCTRSAITSPITLQNL